MKIVCIENNIQYRRFSMLMIPAVFNRLPIPELFNLLHKKTQQNLELIKKPGYFLAMIS